VKSISGKDFAKLLQKNGSVLKRITGSHHIFTKSGRQECISVPLHGNQALKIGLLRALLKLTDIDEREL
jgi:predicted RNA binding protein YcfA (HicA-like mRNA interferase family)